MSLKYHKTLTLFITILCISTIQTNLFGQKTFVPGRIVNMDGDTLEVLIKQSKWRVTPETIEYKTDNSNQAIKGSPDNIRMFQVNGGSRYFSSTVSVDRSSDIHVQLTRSIDPVWEERNVFLEELVKTDISLFSYSTNKIARFYYQQMGTDTYEPLIYKKYIYNQRVKHNRGYRKQIQELFTCNTSYDQLQRLDYRKKDLIKYFSRAGDCSENSEIKISRDLNKPKLTWRLVVGANFMSAELNRTVFSFSTNIGEYNTKSDSFFGAKIGAIGELPLSSKNRDWSMTFEGTYENISFDGTWKNILFVTDPEFRDDQSMSVDVHHIVFNIGFRRNFHVNEDLDIFAAATWSPGFTFDISAKTEVSEVFNNPSTAAAPLVREGGNYGLGLGISTKHVNLELRFNTNRKFLGNSTLFNANVNSFGIISAFRL